MDLELRHLRCLVAIVDAGTWPFPDDALLSRGLWQYAHYYDPAPS